jgi:hypothetical protein
MFFMFLSFATKSKPITNLHHAHYLSQSKYALDHTFLNVVDFNIFGLEVANLLNVSRLEIVNLLFLKLFLKFEYVGIYFPS